MRKLIAFDEDTFDKLRQLARDRMATFQELAEEAFADLLKKHGIPVDLKDALRKSAQPGGGVLARRPRNAPRHGRRRPRDRPRESRIEIQLFQPIFLRPFLKRGPLRI